MDMYFFLCHLSSSVCVCVCVCMEIVSKTLYDGDHILATFK